MIELIRTRLSEAGIKYVLEGNDIVPLDSILALLRESAKQIISLVLEAEKKLLLEVKKGFPDEEIFDVKNFPVEGAVAQNFFLRNRSLTTEAILALTERQTTGQDISKLN